MNTFNAFARTPAHQLPSLGLHTRLAALALSLLCTVAVLQSMDHLATSEPVAPAVMAAASSAQA